MCGLSSPFIVQSDTSLLTVASAGNATLPRICDIQIINEVGVSNEAPNDQFTIQSGSIAGPVVVIDVQSRCVPVFDPLCSAVISTTRPNEVIIVIVVCGFKCNPSVADSTGAKYQLRTNQTGRAGCCFSPGIIEFYYRTRDIQTLDRVSVSAPARGFLSAVVFALANVGRGIWDSSLPITTYNCCVSETTTLSISTSPAYKDDFIIVSMAINDGSNCSTSPSPFTCLDFDVDTAPGTITKPEPVSDLYLSLATTRPLGGID